MKLTPQDIGEFKEIYLQEYGEELTDTEAEEEARRVLQFFSVLFHK